MLNDSSVLSSVSFRLLCRVHCFTVAMETRVEVNDALCVVHYVTGQ